MQLIVGVLGRAGEEGQRRRLDAARNGISTWRSPWEVMNAIQLETGQGPGKGEDDEGEAEAAIPDDIGSKDVGLVR